MRRTIGLGVLVGFLTVAVPAVLAILAQRPDLSEYDARADLLDEIEESVDSIAAIAARMEPIAEDVAANRELWDLANNAEAMR